MQGNMKTRLYNAKILSMVEGQEIFDGEIIIEDGRIVEAYPYPLAEGKGNGEGNVDLSIDCQGNLLMPGFKNAHAHSGMSGMRSLADDKP